MSAASPQPYSQTFIFDIELEKRMAGYAKATAQCVQCMIKAIETYPLKFGHGMTEKEVRSEFPRIIKDEKRRPVKLVTYGNRLRDAVRDGLAGRHDVCHGKPKRHFFPLYLDEQGKIDHSRCVNCEKRKEA